MVSALKAAVLAAVLCLAASLAVQASAPFPVAEDCRWSGDSRAPDAAVLQRSRTPIRHASGLHCPVALFCAAFLIVPVPRRAKIFHSRSPIYVAPLDGKLGARAPPV
jgi:hypothetical protein